MPCCTGPGLAWAGLGWPWPLAASRRRFCSSSLGRSGRAWPRGGRPALRAPRRAPIHFHLRLQRRGRYCRPLPCLPRTCPRIVMAAGGGGTRRQAGNTALPRSTRTRRDTTTRRSDPRRPEAWRQATGDRAWSQTGGHPSEAAGSHELSPVSMDEARVPGGASGTKTRRWPKASGLTLFLSSGDGLGNRLAPPCHGDLAGAEVVTGTLAERGVARCGAGRRSHATTRQ